jgi:hypothetical protein
MKFLSNSDDFDSEEARKMLDGVMGEDGRGGEGELGGNGSEMEGLQGEEVLSGVEEEEEEEEEEGSEVEKAQSELIPGEGAAIEEEEEEEEEELAEEQARILKSALYSDLTDGADIGDLS